MRGPLTRAPGHSGNAANSRDRGLDATPLRLGTSPFSWTCGRGRFGRRPGGRECSAPPRTTQNACLPLSSRMPPLPPISSQPCARLLTRGSPERRACRTRPRMYVRAAGALSCEAVCGATGERVLATPVSRRPLERPSPRRRAGQPDESVAADASGASHGARRAHARERCGACWSSAQRAPEPAYARVT